MLAIRLVAKCFLVLSLTSVTQSTWAQGSPGWAEDLEFLLKSIDEIHPNPYGVHSRESFITAASNLKSQHSELSEHAAALEIQRLLAMVGDGHTEWARMPESLRGDYLPIIFRPFVEGWFIRTGDPAYRPLFGKPITGIAGLAIQDVLDRVLPYVSGENEIGKLDDAANLIRNARVLDALGITDGIAKTVSFTVLESDGSESSIEVAVTDESWVQPHWRDVDKLLNPDVDEPLYRLLDGNYACSWLPDDQLLYVMFSEIRNDNDSTIEEFFGDVYEFASVVRPSKFVLDLRENSGGNLDLNGPVLRGLIANPEMDQPGKVFVAIGPDTYSAAMNLSVLLERYTNSLFVGTPTGATPNHYGDTRVVELPNSKIQVEISELAWQNSDPRDDRPWITPDIPVNPSAALFIAERDPVLETILDFSPPESLAEEFGPPMARWRRQNQLQEEIWPALLSASARPISHVEGGRGLKVESCSVR
ncbi:MAG: hypothetical protein IH951_11585 [Bacteroidetes bacterium]|nr:hypothetical protein [Bacteroidota bacterium]